MDRIIGAQGMGFCKFSGFSDQRVGDFKKDVVFPITVEFLDDTAVVTWREMLLAASAGEGCADSLMFTNCSVAT